MPPPATPSQHRQGESGHGQAAPEAKPCARRIDEHQRQADKRICFGDADLAHQAQRLRIGAETNVLTVVERGRRARPRRVVRIVWRQGSGAAAGHRCHLDQRDRGAGSGGLDGGREPGPAGTDDRDGHGVSGVPRRHRGARTGTRVN